MLEGFSKVFRKRFQLPDDVASIADRICQDTRGATPVFLAISGGLVLAVGGAALYTVQKRPPAVA